MRDDASTLILTLCAVVQDGRILLIQRAKNPYRGHWGLPGGKMRFGETVEAAALREAHEETGLDCRMAGIRGVATEVISSADSPDRPDAHFVMFILELEPTGGTLTESDEGPLRWHPLDTLESIRPFIPTDMMLIRRFLLPQNAIPAGHYDVVRSGDTYAAHERY